MDREDEFKKLAEQAERAAKAATTVTEREAYLKIAKGWRDLLMEAERRRNRT